MMPLMVVGWEDEKQRSCCNREGIWEKCKESVGNPDFLTQERILEKEN